MCCGTFEASVLGYDRRESAATKGDAKSRNNPPWIAICSRNSANDGYQSQMRQRRSLFGKVESF